MRLPRFVTCFTAVRIGIAFVLVAGFTIRLDANTVGLSNGLAPGETSPASRQSVSTPGEVDLSAEARIVSAYTEALVAFVERIDELKRQSPISQAQADAARADAWLLEERVPEVVQAISGAIRKLRDANVWDQVDAFIYERIHDDQLRRLMERDGGPRVRLENSVSEIPDLAYPFFRDTLRELESMGRTARAGSTVKQQLSFSVAA